MQRYIVIPGDPNTFPHLMDKCKKHFALEKEGTLHVVTGQNELQQMLAAEISSHTGAGVFTHRVFNDNNNGDFGEFLRDCLIADDHTAIFVVFESTLSKILKYFDEKNLLTEIILPENELIHLYLSILYLGVF